MENNVSMNELFNLNDYEQLTNSIGEIVTDKKIPEGVMSWYDEILSFSSSSMVYLVKIATDYSILAINEFDKETCKNLFDSDISAMHQHVTDKTELLKNSQIFKNCRIFNGIGSGADHCDEIGVLFDMYNHSLKTIEHALDELDMTVYKKDVNLTLRKKILECTSSGSQKMQILLNLIDECGAKDIDLSKAYYLTDNVYLAFDIDSYSEKLYGYFYFKNDDYLYKNFNASHGDLNVWITGIIKSAVATCTGTTCDYLSDITNISYIRIYINLVTVDSSKRDYITECVNKAVDFAINKRNDSIYDKFEKTVKLLETVPDGYIVNSTILAELTEEYDMHKSGISASVFDIWKNSYDKKSVEDMFELFTDMKFEKYLEKCITETSKIKGEQHNGEQ